MKKYLIMLFLAVSLSLSAQTSYIYEVTALAFAVEQPNGQYKAEEGSIVLEKADYINVIITPDNIFIIQPAEAPLVVNRNTTFHKENDFIEYRCKDSNGQFVKVVKGPKHIAVFYGKDMIWMGYGRHWYAQPTKEQGKTFNDAKDNFNDNYDYSDSRLCLAE